MDNEMTLTFLARSENEGLARIAVTSFMAQLDPTIEELSECKTIVSEAVSNAIIHGYEQSKGKVFIRCTLRGDLLEVEVEDKGHGIPDVELAMEPMYTTKPEADRSGMGFSFMEAFMDELEVYSELNKGTRVFMKKYIKGEVNE